MSNGLYGWKKVGLVGEAKWLRVELCVHGVNEARGKNYAVIVA